MSRYRANQWSEEFAGFSDLASPPDNPLRGITGFASDYVQRYFTKARLKKLGGIFGVKIGRKLGCGAFGCAYATDTPYAVKITADPQEAPMWERYRMAQKRHALPGLPKVQRVIRLDTESDLRDHVYAVLREEAGTYPWERMQGAYNDLEAALQDYKYKAYDFYGAAGYDDAEFERAKDSLKDISRFIGRLAPETRDLAKTLSKLVDLEIPPIDTHMGNLGVRIHPEFGEVGQILFIDPGVTPAEHTPQIREKFAANAARLGRPDVEEVDMRSAAVEYEPNDPEEEVYAFPLTKDEYDALRYLSGKYQSAEILYDNWDDEYDTIPRTAVIASFIATAKDGGDIGVVPGAGGRLRDKIERLYDESGASVEYLDVAHDFYESDIDDPFLFVEGYEYVENPPKPGDVLHREGGYELLYSTDDPPVFLVLRDGEVITGVESHDAQMAYKAALTAFKEAVRGYIDRFEHNARAGDVVEATAGHELVFIGYDEDGPGAWHGIREKGSGTWLLVAHGNSAAYGYSAALSVLSQFFSEEGYSENARCPVGTEVQTLLFDKDDFTKSEAKSWAQENDFKYGKVDETDEYYRLRQEDPRKYQKSGFRTIELSGGVKAVIGRPK